MGRRTYGNVEKLGSGRYRVRYLGPDSIRRTAPETFATRADADRWIATTHTDITKGQWINPAHGDVLLSEYAEAWLSQRTVKGQPLAPRTHQTYRHSLDAWILPKLGHQPLADITPPLIRTWHADIRTTTGPTATRQAYALLRAVLNTAVSDDALHRNPCRITGAGQPNSPERPLLDLTQVTGLIAAMPHHLQALTAVTFWAHLRIGEVLALQHGDIDLTTGILRVDRQQIETKTGYHLTPPKAASRRTIHLPQQGTRALAEWIATQPPALPLTPLFSRPDGTRLRIWHIEWPWRQARTTVGVPNAHFHDLRHAGLTLTAQLGATQAEVMRRAGHSTQRAAQTYQHAADNRDHLIAQRLSSLGVTGSMTG